MNNHSFAYTSVAVLAALAIAITMSPTNIGEIKPSYAQSTFDTPSGPGSDIDSPTETGTVDDGENFQQFMECLFEGEADDSNPEEDGSSSTDGETSDDEEESGE